jgi:hypothetical protein
MWTVDLVGIDFLERLRLVAGLVQRVPLPGGLDDAEEHHGALEHQPLAVGWSALERGHGFLLTAEM